MPTKTQGNGTTTNTKRTPAVNLLSKFLTDNNVILIMDKQPKLSKDADGLLYSVNDLLRLRAFYRDEIKDQDTSETKGKKVDING